jgi:dihydroceramidase
MSIVPTNSSLKDYYATVYSAEIVNTLTNLMFVFLAYKGISSCIRYGHERVFLIGFLGYLSIGVGSMCFHSSLKCKHNYSSTNGKTNLAPDPMQLLDELSMIYTTCIMVYALFSYRQSTRTCIAIFIAISSLAVFITGYYHYVQDPKFHQNMFALLTVIVVFKTMYMMEFLLRPSRRANRGDVKLVDDAEKARANRRDECLRAQCHGDRVSDLETGYHFLRDPATLASRCRLAMGHFT